MNLPTIPLPIGILLSPLKTRIEKFFLLDTYLKSHSEYLKRDGFLVLWKEIGANIQASLSMPSILDNERIPMARIAVQRTNSELIDRLSLLIEAESDFCKYQDIVTFSNVGKKPIIATLPSIPLRAFYISEGHKHTESMNVLRISILQFSSTQQQIVCPNTWSATTYPNTIDLLNDRFEERWGTYWNMAAIDSAIQEKAHYLNYYLASPKVFYGSGSKFQFSAHVKSFFRAFVGRPLCWLLTRGWLLKAYF